MATQDDPLAAEMAEGMRSTSAGGVFLWLPFFAQAKKVTRPARAKQALRARKTERFAAKAAPLKV